MRKLVYLIAIVGLVHSCSRQSSVAEGVVYIVNFDSNGGSLVASQQIKEGEKANRPSNPTKEGDISYLEGWYLNDVEYDFDSPVNSNLFLVAKWGKATYEVVYKNGGTALDTKTVANASILTVPTEDTYGLSKTGYHIGAWMLEGTNTEWDFSKLVKDDLTLVARWDINVYDVRFCLAGGCTPPQSIDTLYRVEHGSVVPDHRHWTIEETILPQGNPPAVFDCWKYHNGTAFVPVPLDLVVTKNLNISATWKLK